MPVPAERAIAVLEAAPRELIGSRLQAVHVAREVHVGFGHLLADDGAVVLPVWWEDAEQPELFPTFDGGIELRDDHDHAGVEVRLAGSYRPPLGTLGEFVDRIVGHRIVATTLDAFVEDVVTRLTAAAADG